MVSLVKQLIFSILIVLYLKSLIEGDLLVNQDRKSLQEQYFKNEYAAFDLKKISKFNANDYIAFNLSGGVFLNNKKL